MKKPEELAEEYTRDWWGNLPEAEGMRKSARENFLAGYKAAQARWIPVGEAMPKKRVDVLVKLRDKRNGDYWLAFDYAISKKSWSEKWEHSEAIAWMPLPEMEEWRDDK